MFFFTLWLTNHREDWSKIILLRTGGKWHPNRSTLDSLASLRSGWQFFFKRRNEAAKPAELGSTGSERRQRWRAHMLLKTSLREMNELGQWPGHRSKAFVHYLTFSYIYLNLSSNEQVRSAWDQITIYELSSTVITRWAFTRHWLILPPL